MNRHMVIIESNASFLNIIPTARKLNWRITFLYSPARSSWYNNDKEGLLKSATTVQIEDSADAVCIKQALENLLPIDLVLSPLEFCVEATAQACEQLALKFTPLVGVQNAQDKLLARKLISDIDPTVSLPIRSYSDLEKAVLTIGYPAFFKPRKGTSSIGATKISDSNDLQKAWENARTHYSKISGEYFSSDFILESYLNGRMLSVEVSASNDEVKILMIDERFRSTNREQVEIGTCMPAQLTSAQLDSVENFIKLTLARLNLVLGVFHVELMLCGNSLHLIEANPRLMGGSLPLLYNFSTGDNIFEKLINAYSDQPVQATNYRYSGLAMSRIFGAAHSGILAPNWNFGPIFSLFKSADDFKINFWKQPGESINPLVSNADYIGFFFIRSDSIETAHELCEQVLSELDRILGVQLLR